MQNKMKWTLAAPAALVLFGLASVNVANAVQYNSPITVDGTTITGQYKLVDGDTHYLVNNSEGTLDLVRDGAVVKSITFGDGINSMALDESEHKVYVTDIYKNTVSVVADGKIEKTIPVGRWPAAIAIDQSQHKVYVVNNTSKTVSVLKDGNVENTINLASGLVPWDVAVDQSDGSVYVSTSASVNGQTVGQLLKIENDAVVQTTPIAGFGYQIVLDQDTHGVYVNHTPPRANTSVSYVVDNNVAKYTELPSRFDASGFDASSRTLYVSGQGNYLWSFQDGVLVNTAR
jgi:YVTN family beta-propeller protein